VNRSWWRDPDYRRDVLIVVGLFGLGLLFNVVVALILLVGLDLFGLLGAQSGEMDWAPSITARAGSAEAVTERFGS
jgi:hypothetical protein